MSKRLTPFIFLIMILSVLFTSCSRISSTDIPKVSPVKAEYHTTGEKGTLTPPSVEGYELTVQNEYLSLYFRKELGNFAVFDKRTGEIWKSNPDIAESAPSVVRSQIRITYQNSNGVINSMDSYTECAKKGQIGYETKGDTLKVTYTFGNVGWDVSQTPQKISDKRFQMYLSRLNEEDQKDLKRRYGYAKTTDSWMRRSLSELTKKSLFELMEKIGYTEQDLAIDNRENNISADSSVKQLFVIPITYVLDKDSLRVSVVTKEIVYPELNPITRLELLEYFGCMEAKEDGFIFVPDGSGSVIGTEPVKLGASGYSARVYGTDETAGLNEKRNSNKTVLMPVFGITKKDCSVLTIIEDSEALAVIESNKAGSKNNYATVYAAYEVYKSELITLGGNSASGHASFYKFQTEPYQGEIAQRYIFLTKEKKGYPGMAQKYREYLTDRYDFKPLSEEKQIPFYLETVGAIDFTKSFLGIKYDGKQALTTYKDNVNILKNLKDNGIENISLKISGWFNGGVEQSLADQVNLMSVLGGKSAFKELVSFVQKNNIKFYPGSQFATLSAEDSIFKRNANVATTLNDIDAVQYIYNDATNGKETSKKHNFRYITSSAVHDKLLNSYYNSLSKLYSDGFSIEDISKTVYSDYAKSYQIDRQEALLMTTNAIKSMSDKNVKLLLNSPNVNTAPYSKSFTGVPMEDSGYLASDYSVPFYQMVFHGYADYSFDALNTMSDYKNALLKCLEYGASPSYKWVYRNNKTLKNSDYSYLFATDYESWFDEAVTDYKKINDVLSPLRTKQIINHQKLSDGVFKTTYEDNTSIIVNYNGYDVTVENQTIKALNFAVVKDGETK